MATKQEAYEKTDQTHMASVQNKYDYLEKKYGIGPDKIYEAISKVGYAKAKLDAYFMVETYLAKKAR